MKWGKSRQQQFTQFIIDLGFIDVEGDIYNLDDEEDAKLVISKKSYEHILGCLHLDIPEDTYDDEWHEWCCDEILNFIDKIEAKNPHKGKRKLSEIDFLIGQCFCIIRSKPETLCQEIKDGVRANIKSTSRFKGKTEFSVDEIKQLVEMAFGFEVESSDDANKDISPTNYGLTPDNPIRVSSVHSSYTYLNFLKCSSADEQIINKVRIGSMSHDNLMLDKWQITIKNTKRNLTQNIILYINGYAGYDDFDNAPKGFVMKIGGVNE